MASMQKTIKYIKNPLTLYIKLIKNIFIVIINNINRSNL